MELSTLSSFRNILREIKSDGLYRMEIPSLCIEQVESLSSYYSISQMQVVLLAAVIDICGYGTVDCSELSRALQCDFFSFLSLKKDLDALRNRALVEGVRQISVPQGLIDSIAENRPYRIGNLSDLSTKLILEKLATMKDDVVEKRKSPIAFLRAADSMILSNQSTSVAMVSDRYGILCYNSVPEDISENDRYTCSMQISERMLFYCLLSRIDDRVSWYELSPFFSPMEMKNMQQKVRGSALTLLREGTVYFASDNSSEEYLEISPKVKEQILPDLGRKVKDHAFGMLMHPSSMTPRKLFYPQQVSERVAELTGLLSKERFMLIRESLAGSGLRTGFAVLFYGDPGTGKTETAIQIARYTSRDLIYVNVADIKDSYVGQTEKNIKGVFDSYRKYVSEKGVYPILLFNEADALLGVRMEHPRGAADRMENSMQNIILEEMERLDGIMVATTNLSVNLDKAFDRRFLYRIRFTRPDLQSRTQMLVSMIPELAHREAETIAAEFQLSGGQIENICRRKTILSAVKGRPLTFAEIRHLCMDESSGETSGRKIGF